MRMELMDVLACPIDKHYPLDLHVFEKKDGEVEEGIIFCSKCGRVYPIIRKIPELLPDDMRDVESDVAFLKKWHKKLRENNVAWRVKNITHETTCFGEASD